MLSANTGSKRKLKSELRFKLRSSDTNITNSFLKIVPNAYPRSKLSENTVEFKFEEARYLALGKADSNHRIGTYRSHTLASGGRFFYVLALHGLTSRNEGCHVEFV